MLVALTTDSHFGFRDRTHKHHSKVLKRLKRDMLNKGSRVLLHTGDWGVWRQRQTKKAFEIFRSELGPDIQIVCVLGNHDFWHDRSETPLITLQDALDWHDQWIADLGIHYLEKGGIRIEDVHFLGFDGWYGNPNVHSLTNDILYMPLVPMDSPHVDAHAFMSARAQRSLQRLLDEPTTGDRKVVGLTHFPLFGGFHDGNKSWMPFVSDKCDIICFGHSHEKIHALPVDKSLIYNAGSDYGDIQYDFIEV